MLKVGDRVEEFSAVNQDGQSVSLSSFLADGPLVIYFYVKAKTPG